MHKKKRRPKRLLLDKEVVKLLSTTTLVDVRGGVTVPITYPPEECRG
jgi:hypothetical protein